MSNNMSIIKVTNVALIAVLLGKVLGLAKQVILSSSFGTTLETDIINLSLNLIMTVQYIFSQMIFSAYVVVYLKAKQSNIEKEKMFIRDSSLLFFIYSIILSLVFIILAPYVVKIIAPSYSTENHNKLCYYVKLFSLLLTPSIFISYFEALLNANEKFTLRELATSVQNVAMVVFILFIGRRMGISGLVFSHFVYNIVVFLYLLIFVIPYLQCMSIENLCLPWKNPDVKSLIKLMLPMLVSYAMIYLNQQIDKILASGMESGSVSALAYGSSLSNMVLGFFTTIIMIIYTRSSDYVNKNNFEKSESLIYNATSLLFCIAIPASIVTFFCASDIVSILFFRGAFTSDSVRMTSYTLKGYCVTFMPYVIKNIFSKYQYSYQNVKAPMIIGGIGIGINILLSIILGRWIGLFGIAFASSIAELFAGFLNYLTASRFHKVIGKKHYLRRFTTLTITSVPVVCIAYVLSIHTEKYNSFIRFTTIAICTITIYCLLNIKIINKSICLLKSI